MGKGRDETVCAGVGRRGNAKQPEGGDPKPEFYTAKGFWVRSN